MDAVAGRAAVEGVDVLREMYFSQLPSEVAERAWGIASSFDGGSVATTSRFIASGVQPFASDRELRAISVPTLLVPGNDPVHPGAVSELYAESIPAVTAAPPNEPDTTGVIRDFLDRRSAGR
jgi:hypothetical protein